MTQATKSAIDQAEDQADDDPLDRPVGGPVGARPPRTTTRMTNGPPNETSVIAPSKHVGQPGDVATPAHDGLAAARAWRRSWQNASCRRRAAASSARIASAAVAAGTCFASASVPPLDLDRPVLQPALADHDAERDADQVGVLELDARPLVAVVDQDVEPGRRRAPSRAPAACSITAAFWTWSGTTSDLIGRERQRPDDAVGVVAGLDGRRRRSG